MIISFCKRFLLRRSLLRNCVLCSNVLVTKAPIRKLDSFEGSFQTSSRMSNLPRASDDDSEDSDVAAAIRMSLADMNGKSKDKAPMIDLTSDNEQPERNIHDDTTASESESDEDLKAAIKLSMKTATQASHEQRDIENYRLPGDSTTASESEGEEAALEKEIRKQPLSAKDQTGSVVRPASNEGQTSDPQDTQSVFARLGLDRKKLEEERLARQRAKRKASASVSPPPVSRQSKTRKVDEGLGTAKNVAEESTPKGSTSQPHLQFPHGVVKKTWAFGQPRMGDDIKIEEVLQKETLQVAVLSSFIWDYDWIFPKIAVNRTRLVLIHHAKYPEQVRPVVAMIRNLVCDADLSYRERILNQTSRVCRAFDSVSHIWMVKSIACIQN